MQKHIRNNLVIGDCDKYELLAGLPRLGFSSVSDCGGLSAAVVAERPVGVDLQGGRAREGVARRFYSRRERELPFALVWARKEAYAKWLGTGLTHRSLLVDTCDLTFEEYDLGELCGLTGFYLAVYLGEDLDDDAAAEAFGARVEDGGLAGGGAADGGGEG